MTNYGLVIRDSNEHIKIQSESGATSLVFSVEKHDTPIWEDVVPVSLSIETRSEGHSEYFRSSFAPMVFFENQKNVFQRKFRLLKNNDGNQASGCFRAVN